MTELGPLMLDQVRDAAVSTAKPHTSQVPGEAWRLLYTHLKRLAGSADELDDLVQAAAERAVRCWPRFEGRCALSTWTYQIAYRTWLDHQRWVYRWRRRFALGAEASLRTAPAPSNPECETKQKARAEALHRALQRLPAQKRAVVILFELEGLSLAEVAQIVGCNDRTVRSRLHDGRLKLLGLLRSDPRFEAFEAEVQP